MTMVWRGMGCWSCAGAGAGIVIRSRLTSVMLGEGFGIVVALVEDFGTKIVMLRVFPGPGWRPRCVFVFVLM